MDTTSAPAKEKKLLPKRDEQLMLKKRVRAFIVRVFRPPRKQQFLSGMD